MKVSVLVPAMTLPSLVATSLACDGITAFGLINSLITNAASFGPVRLEFLILSLIQEQTQYRTTPDICRNLSAV